MSEAKLDVIVKAINLMEYTMTITSNRKRYPVKHLTLVKRIQNRCMDIYEAYQSNMEKYNVVLDEREILQCMEFFGLYSIDKIIVLANAGG